MLNAPAFVIQVCLAVAALLLCLFSVLTSRSQRPRHRTFFAWAIALVVLSVMVWFLDVAVKLLSEIQGDPDDWLLFLMVVTVVVCVLPIWRSVQSGRIRDKLRERRASPPQGP